MSCTIHATSHPQLTVSVRGLPSYQPRNPHSHRWVELGFCALIALHVALYRGTRGTPRVVEVNTRMYVVQHEQNKILVTDKILK